MLAEFKFHHIGYAVKNIEETARIYINEGWELSIPIVDPLQNVRIAFLEREDMPLIELVEPVDEKSPVTQILEKSGVSTYHICYEVEDIDEAVKRMRKLCFVQLFKPVIAVALDNRKICYLFNNSVGLIEIVQ